MQCIEILETVASACKTLSEVPGLDQCKSRRGLREPPDGRVGRKARSRPSAPTQVARGARTALELTRFATYLLRLAEYLSGIGG